MVPHPVPGRGGGVPPSLPTEGTPIVPDRGTHPRLDGIPPSIRTGWSTPVRTDGGTPWT